MKVYTKVVVDIATMETIEAESYEHDGPAALCKGGNDPQPTPETAQEIELSKIAEEQWNDYQARFVPMENEFIRKVHLDEGDRNQVAGEVNAVMAKKEAGLQSANRAVVEKSGYDPGSGRAAIADGQTETSIAQAKGEAQGRAGEQVTDKELAGLQSVVGMGRGQATDAQFGLGDVANTAVNKSLTDEKIADNERWSRRGETASLIGAGAALGVNAYGGMKKPAKEDPVKVGNNQASGW